jgi:CBS domain-containing protein
MEKPMHMHQVPQTVREIMTPDPIVLEAHATVADAARTMTILDIGDVLVARDGKLVGIVTDRDLVVRYLAKDGTNGKRLGDLCTCEIATVDADAEVSEAVRMMQERAIRRIPVTEDGLPVGIVSLGDVAIARDAESALGRISAARPNR